MDAGRNQVGESLVNVPDQNGNKTPTKVNFTRNTARFGPQIGGSKYRMGSFARSLLEKAQSSSSDLQLSPTTIEALMNPMRTKSLRVPTIVPSSISSKDLTFECKANTTGDAITKSGKVNPPCPRNAFKDLTLENKKDITGETLDRSANVYAPYVPSSAVKDLTLENKKDITGETLVRSANVHAPYVSSSAVKDVTLENKKNITGEALVRFANVHAPYGPNSAAADLTLENKKETTGEALVGFAHVYAPYVPGSAVKDLTLENKKDITGETLVRTANVYAPCAVKDSEELSSECIVAYRQSNNDALSSELRSHLRNQPTLKLEAFTPNPKFRSNVNIHGNSEIPARIPPAVPLGEQNSNTGSRTFITGQPQMGVGTPVAPRTQFRPPSSTGKGKIASANTKKPANSWKFRSETVDGKDYLILKELGKGGCGHVDLVIEKESRQLYALKKVNMSGINEAVILECINEVEMLVALKDTDLVIRIFSWEMSHSEKTIKIVMEYGQCDLNSSVKATTFSIPKLKYIWERMLMITATIHERGIIHADLKPANFVWVGDSLKIIDFGIANRLQSDLTSIATLNPKGTMNFISPETIRPDATGKTKISPKSDIWSLGCILYMMVYGKTPFQDITNYVAKIGAISSGIVNYPVLPLDLQYSGVIEVMESCFQLNPKSRPTAEELLTHRFLH